MRFRKLFRRVASGDAKPRKQQLSLQDLVRIGHGVCDAMKYLEGKKIVHRDLAAR